MIQADARYTCIHYHTMTYARINYLRAFRDTLLNWRITNKTYPSLNYECFGRTFFVFKIFSLLDTDQQKEDAAFFSSLFVAIGVVIAFVIFLQVSISDLFYRLRLLRRIQSKFFVSIGLHCTYSNSIRRTVSTRCEACSLSSQL